MEKIVALAALGFGIIDLAALNLLVAPAVFVVAPAPNPVPVRVPVPVLLTVPEPTQEPEQEPEGPGLGPGPGLGSEVPVSWSLLFGTGSASLDGASIAALREVIEAAQTRDGILEITGSADPRGVEARNFALSEKRARAVARWLEKRGVAPARMKISGVGEVSPDIPGEPGFRSVRRVEITLGRQL